MSFTELWHAVSVQNLAIATMPIVPVGTHLPGFVCHQNSPFRDTWRSLKKTPVALVSMRQEVVGSTAMWHLIVRGINNMGRLVKQKPSLTCR